MKRRQKADYLVKCPFYVKESKDEIICCGIYKNCGTHLAFGESKITKREHKNVFCKRLENYENCPIAQMILARLEEAGQ